MRYSISSSDRMGPSPNGAQLDPKLYSLRTKVIVQLVCLVFL